MSDRGASAWLPAAASVGAALSLIGPWARSGAVDRSSIELVGTAGALDVLSDSEQVLAAGAWFLVVVAAAVALVAAAWGKRHLAAVCALPMGPALTLAWAVLVASPLTVRWAAPTGVLLGLTATVAGTLVLLDVGTRGRRHR